MAHKKKERKPFLFWCKNIALVCLIAYGIFTFMSQQAKLDESRANIRKLKEQIIAAQQENDEYRDLLSTEDESEYMKKIAIERLGYGYPNEIRFYPTYGW